MLAILSIGARGSASNSLMLTEAPAGTRATDSSKGINEV